MIYQIDQKLLEDLDIPPIAAVIIRDIHNYTVDKITIALAKMIQELAEPGGIYESPPPEWEYELVRLMADWDPMHPPYPESEKLLNELLKANAGEVE